MAIIYQLPNGKCVHLSVEQLIHLDQADIQFMIAEDMGYESNNPHRKLKYPDKDSELELESDFFISLDDAPDMLSDGDDDGPEFDINNIPDS